MSRNSHIRSAAAGLAPMLMSTALLALPACAADFNDAAPNAPQQTPAFPEQTRAPVIADDVALKTEVVADGLEHPWGMDQMPDGAWLVTEKPGRLRVIAPDGTASEPISGVPEVDARGQGGLLDVLLAPDFAQTRRLWLSFAAPAEGGKNQTAVVTATLAHDNRSLQDVREIFRQQPAWDSDKHYGSRLVLDPEGKLFVTLGERSNPDSRALAQNDDNHIGKLVRVDPQGGAAGAGTDGWLPDTLAKGFRNVQSAALDPQGRLWTVEHGPKGGDELNRPEPGRNYGWPVITYGVDYSGGPIGEGLTAAEGMEQPLYYWDPVIAPSGMVFYDGEMFADWQGDILIGGLRDQSLVRLQMDGDRVTGEARYLQGNARIRDVDVAADGAIMLLTDAANGALIRVTPE
ncbi:PQQ-dependent sugar dehydrogenase [uncultured Paracoccus sp.]|uniref:PQQ-dependent sugar dehydrogenase n=1 Tax=uncultured Paracoccus sp. TaxID=189685 RepID=UPI0026203C2C|nr:PQQ-dependent sugar dehydrogenase [uncultured Paracoccus sp.]